MTIFLFPGFLGEGSDFDPLRKELSQLLPLQFQIVDVPRVNSALTEKPIGELGARLISLCQKPAGECLGLGYSLGGRLMLEMMKIQPDFFSAWMFLSVNPGLSGQDEKNLRRQNDDQWARKFLQESWSQVMTEWNAQGVFSGSVAEPLRKEDGLERKVLAQILRRWSLAEQNDARESLARMSCPSLWLAGGRDQKFVQLLSTLPPSQQVTKTIVKEAGHRVHLDQPRRVAEDIHRWLGEVLHKKTAELEAPLRIPPQ